MKILVFVFASIRPVITNTLLVVKTENIYRNTRKMHITMETEQSFLKPFKGRALFPSLCAFLLYVDIYFRFSPQMYYRVIMKVKTRFFT